MINCCESTWVPAASCPTCDNNLHACVPAARHLSMFIFSNPLLAYRRARRKRCIRRSHGKCRADRVCRFPLRGALILLLTLLGRRTELLLNFLENLTEVRSFFKNLCAAPGQCKTYKRTSEAQTPSRALVSVACSTYLQQRAGLAVPPVVSMVSSRLAYSWCECS